MTKLISLYNLISKQIHRPITINSRLISTSNTLRSTKKHWISYGFCHKDNKYDKWSTKCVFFTAITLCMVCGGFVWLYVPDYQMRDWAQREAYLEIRRRENCGLPLLSPNIVDSAMVVLPTDDELNDKGTEIII